MFFQNTLDSIEKWKNYYKSNLFQNCYSALLGPEVSQFRPDFTSPPSESIRAQENIGPGSQENWWYGSVPTSDSTKIFSSEGCKVKIGRWSWGLWRIWGMKPSIRGPPTESLAPIFLAYSGWADTIFCQTGIEPESVDIKLYRTGPRLNLNTELWSSYPPGILWYSYYYGNLIKTIGN